MITAAKFGPRGDPRVFGPIRIYRRHLPHLRVPGHPYFVTWRLHRLQRLLSDPERELVVQAILHFSTKRYDILGYAVMDDHVHVVVLPKPGVRLEDVVHSWKSFTANQLQRRSKRHGKVWQNEYYERLIRSRRELSRTLKYVEQNPFKRWPTLTQYRWMWCSATVVTHPRKAGGGTPLDSGR
ncbi:MAG: transposase [Bacteroidota bacterium]